MGAPQHLRERVALAYGERVVEGGERAVGESTVALDAPLGGGDARQPQLVSELVERAAEGEEKADEEQKMQPRRDEGEEPEQGEGHEEADDTRGRPGGGPQQFPEEGQACQAQRARPEGCSRGGWRRCRTARHRLGFGLARHAAPRAAPSARVSSQSGMRSRRTSSS